MLISLRGPFTGESAPTEATPIVLCNDVLAVGPV
jgi:hypothetical protein